MNNFKKHYINPQDLIEYLYEADAINGRTAKLINQFPEEDVVKVVRCRDCEFTYEWRGRLYCKRVRDRWNHVNDLMVEDTDFCTWGKRKDGGEEE